MAGGGGGGGGGRGVGGMGQGGWVAGAVCGMKYIVGIMALALFFYSLLQQLHDRPKWSKKSCRDVNMPLQV